MAKNIKVIENMSNNLLLILSSLRLSCSNASQRTNEGIIQAILSFICKGDRVYSALETNTSNLGQSLKEQTRKDPALVVKKSLFKRT